MLQRFKKSSLGQFLYRLSKRRMIGWPIRVAVRIANSEALQIDHLKAENRAHNRRQTSTLETFERETRQ